MQLIRLYSILSKPFSIQEHDSSTPGARIFKIPVFYANISTTAQSGIIKILYSGSSPVFVHVCYNCFLFYKKRDKVNTGKVFT